MCRLTILQLKQEFLAVMLGVSRSTVTNISIAAQKCSSALTWIRCRSKTPTGSGRRRKVPYREVGQITLPAQEAYSNARKPVEEKLSYNPAHTLAAHQPPGAVNRARLLVYGVIAANRRELSGVTDREPANLQDVMV